MCPSMSATALPDGQERDAHTAASGGLDVSSYLQRWLAHARGRGRGLPHQGHEAPLPPAPRGRGGGGALAAPPPVGAANPPPAGGPPGLAGRPAAPLAAAGRGR